MTEINAREGEPSFIESLQGVASFCESAARAGGMPPDDLQNVIAKLRDAAFVISQFTKLRDDLRAENYRLREHVHVLREALEPFADHNFHDDMSICHSDNESVECGFSYDEFAPLMTLEVGDFRRAEAARAATQPVAETKEHFVDVNKMVDPTAGDGWQPIESAPKDGSDILVYAADPGSDGDFLVVSFDDRVIDLRFPWATADGINHPTAIMQYWRPLPPLPAAKKERG